MSAEILTILLDIQTRVINIESNMGIKGASPAVDEAKLSLSVTAFDEYTTSFLDPFNAACDNLGGDAAKGGVMLSAAIINMRTIIAMASSCKEPAAAALPALLLNLTNQIKAISSATQRNEWEKHMKTLAEGAQSLNWLVVKPSPCDFIMSYAEGADYWANNIRKEFRTTDPKQIAFCDTFKALILELNKYVREHHKTGLTWNPKGGDTSSYIGGAQASPVKPAPAPAAVAAPKQAPIEASPTKSVSPVRVGGGGGGSDLFASLNKGGNITAGLKTVTKDQQTWRSEYKGPEGVHVNMANAAAAVAARNAPTSAVKGPPRLEFQNAGSKWLVENQSDAEGVITVKITEMKETVYIYGCMGATIDIKGKCKSIVVDGCKKTKVLFDTAMASCEVINCQRMQIQCREKVAAVAIDKTDGIIVFLPVSSLDTEIVASKSSEMNLSWPDEKGEMVERPIPEQYKHHIKGMTVTAEVSDLYTH